MYVKINKPTVKTLNNSATCRPLVKYLSKEQEQAGEHVKFFDQDNDNVSSFEVVENIDNNIAKLGKDESKYYMLSINPSSSEQKHIISQITNRSISNIKDLTKAEKGLFDKKLKEFANDVMDGYARNFNRRVFNSDSLTQENIANLKSSLEGHINKCLKYSEYINDKSLSKLTENYQKEVNALLSSKMDIDNLKKIDKLVSTSTNNYLNTLESIPKTDRIKDKIKTNIIDVRTNFDVAFKRDMSGKDLLYYGQIEHTRRYTLEDAKKDIKKITGNISKAEENVLSNKIISRKEIFSNDVKYKISKCDDIRKAEIYSRIGMQKEGLQSHAHIIVSRKDLENKIKLSPFANARNAKNSLDGRSVQIGFDRKKFVEMTEKRFDARFEYVRQNWDSFQYRYGVKQTLKNSFKQSIKNQAYSVSGLGGIGQRIEGATKIKDPLDAARFLVSQNPVAANCLKVVSGASNPAKLALDIAKKLGKHITQAASL